MRPPIEYFRVECYTDFDRYTETSTGDNNSQTHAIPLRVDRQATCGPYFIRKIQTQRTAFDKKPNKVREQKKNA